MTEHNIRPFITALSDITVTPYIDDLDADTLDDAINIMTRDTIDGFIEYQGEPTRIHEYPNVTIYEWSSTKQRRRAVDFYVADLGEWRVSAKM